MECKGLFGKCFWNAAQKTHIRKASRASERSRRIYTHHERRRLLYILHSCGGVGWRRVSVYGWTAVELELWVRDG